MRLLLNHPVACRPQVHSFEAAFELIFIVIEMEKKNILLALSVNASFIDRKKYKFRILKFLS